jgi:hypothetical protein
MRGDTGVALIELDVGTLHAPGDTHGVARCGAVMRSPWQAGPTAVVAEKAVRLCRGCYPQWAS